MRLAWAVGHRWPACRSASCRCAVGLTDEVGAAGESMLEVGPEVFDVFAASADAQQVVGDDALLGGVAATALERRLDASEACGVGEDGDGVDERVGACGAAAHAEGEHEPGTVERVAAALVLGMGCQARVAHLADLGMVAEALGQ